LDRVKRMILFVIICVSFFLTNEVSENLLGFWNYTPKGPTLLFI